MSTHFCYFASAGGACSTCSRWAASSCLMNYVHPFLLHCIRRWGLQHLLSLVGSGLESYEFCPPISVTLPLQVGLGAPAVAGGQQAQVLRARDQGAPHAAVPRGALPSFLAYICTSAGQQSSSRTSARSRSSACCCSQRCVAVLLHPTSAACFSQRVRDQ